MYITIEKQGATKTYVLDASLTPPSYSPTQALTFKFKEIFSPPCTSPIVLKKLNQYYDNQAFLSSLLIDYIFDSRIAQASLPVQSIFSFFNFPKEYTFLSNSAEIQRSNFFSSFSNLNTFYFTKREQHLLIVFNESISSFIPFYKNNTLYLHLKDIEPFLNRLEVNLKSFLQKEQLEKTAEKINVDNLLDIEKEMESHIKMLKIALNGIDFKVKDVKYRVKERIENLATQVLKLHTEFRKEVETIQDEATQENDTDSLQSGESSSSSEQVLSVCSDSKQE